MSSHDPHQHAQQRAAAWGTHAWNWIIDRTRAYASAKLAFWMAGGLGTVATAAFVLPVAVAVAFAVVVTALATWAVAAHHLLHRERRVNSWSSVQSLRARQGEARAQAAVREATLVIADQPGRDSDVQMRAYPPLAAAVRYSKGRVRAALGTDAPPAGSQREPVPPKAPDLDQVRRELKGFRAQDEAIEASIQALAAPSAEREADADELAEAWQRAKVADMEARARVRSGKRPTSPRGELGFDLSLGRDGTLSVERLPRKATPEQRVRGERLENQKRPAA